MQKRFGIVIAFFLSACTTNPIPEENFEAPTLKFPLLGNVPDRPVLPTPETLSRQQRQLKTDHDIAVEKQEAILKAKK
ncbi:MAG: hypothetical protein K2Y18_06825 [Alphaproteobacteria bacterium]|jgi:hypothetical protein|nr:hypothetical protein [Alphaproteobacteria bacterium]